MNEPQAIFSCGASPALSAARLSHLARLLGGIGLNPKGKRVLDVCAGNGDQMEFWLKRGAVLTAADSSPENLDLLRQRFPTVNSFYLKLDQPENAKEPDKYDIVLAFGAVDHLQDPAGALLRLADKCSEFLFLETCVRYGDGPGVKITKENDENPPHATSSYGRRPTRSWIFEELKKHFPYVYQPSYQPDHPQFPIDWLPPASERKEGPARTTFVAARTPVKAQYFFPQVLDRQTRQAKRDNVERPGLDGLLARTGFGLVLDVGANHGQFAAKLRTLGYKGPIASFEPMTAAFAQLAAAVQNDDLIRPFPFALGKQTETREIFISGNSASSSFLPIEDTTVAAEPMTAIVGKENVSVRRLDDVAEDIFSSAQDGPILLKLDTQGTERDVLEGAAIAFERIDYILSECSLISVYRGEPLIEDQIEWMRNRGFDPISMGLGWSDPQTGHTYQIDILFKRR